jgi:hypothetical protein
MPVSFIGGRNWSTRRKPPYCRKSLTNFITYCCIEHTSPWRGFELTTLVVIGTDCIGSYKSNYHTTMTTTVPRKYTVCTRFEVSCRLQFLVCYLKQDMFDILKPYMPWCKMSLSGIHHCIMSWLLISYITFSYFNLVLGTITKHFNIDHHLQLTQFAYSFFYH